ncbi:MAG: hypothetical protein MUO24_03570 [Desulfobacterales bacterium]|nr:hypothetical protein [Desulfobacterales bacterium]
MAPRFNPLDPLGLFQERDGTAAGALTKTRFDVSQRGIASVQEISNTLWPPPDPLGLFHRSNPGNPERRRFLPPDPLGIITPGVPGATIGNPVPIEWAADVIPVKTQVREQLIGKGYTPKQVDKALHWGENWLMGMARRLAPNNPDLQKTVVVSGYADISSRAEDWLRGIEEFASAR